MRDYEVTIIIQPNLEEEGRTKLIERISELLLPGASDEEKPVPDEWGMRSLAYSIEKNREGYYIFYDTTLDPTRITEIERSLQYIEDVLRYLVVRKEG